MGFNSIRARLSVTITLSTAILMLMVCGGLIWQMRHLAERNAEKLLRATTEQINAELSDGEQHYALSEVMEENQSRLRTDNLAMVIVNSQGRVLQKSQENIPLTARPQADLWRVASVPFRGNTILIGLPWEKTGAALNYQAVVLLALALFVTLISAVGSWWLVGRTLLPIAGLSRQAREASAERLQLRLFTPSQDTEIVELVGTLNELLERVAQTAAEKSRFYAAASHELRTPLQVLSGTLEVALNRERNREEYREVVREADAQTRQLTSLVRDLLWLNQLDFVPSQPPREYMNLSATVCHVLTQFQPLIEHKHLQVETRLPPETLIEAPPVHVEMLIRNLLENAVKYTAEQGSVHIELSLLPDTVRLVILNAYPSSLQLDCKQLFEPFYRPDPSRNLNSGGNGLGLAICKSIADVNQWDLKLEQNEQGVCATVAFARSQSASGSAYSTQANAEYRVPALLPLEKT